MNHNGRSAAHLMRTLVPIVRELPPGGKLVLKEQRRPGAIEYSVFLTTDFQGLLCADTRGRTAQFIQVATRRATPGRLDRRRAGE